MSNLTERRTNRPLRWPDSGDGDEAGSVIENDQRFVTLDEYDTEATYQAHLTPSFCLTSLDHGADEDEPEDYLRNGMHDMLG